MSYNPATDFLALVRNAGGAAHFAEMPGLDYVVSAMARAGLFRLWTGQTPPTVNQATTVWLKPSVPSWVAEGAVFLWSPATSAYAAATPALWTALLTPGGYSFQSVAGAAGVIGSGVTILAVQRAAPAATALILPNLVAQWLTGRKLRIVDFSTGVTNHAVTLTTPDGSTIMQKTSWALLSNADQLAGLMLQPCPDLNSWIIAP